MTSGYSRRILQVRKTRDANDRHIKCTVTKASWQVENVILIVRPTAIRTSRWVVAPASSCESGMVRIPPCCLCAILKTNEQSNQKVDEIQPVRVYILRRRYGWERKCRTHRRNFETIRRHRSYFIQMVKERMFC